jgi:hypothetical protein
MHPVVRGHAAELLEEGDRKQTFLTVRDHFDSLPPDDLKKATELSHVKNSLDIYRCLVGARHLDEAFDFYRGDLSNTLFFHLGAHTVIVELLTPLFHGGRDGLPWSISARDQSHILNDLAIAVDELGRSDEALALLAKALRVDLDTENWSEVAIDLRNISASSSSLNRRAESAAALALDLAKASKDDHGVSVTVHEQAVDAIDQGRFADGKRLLDNFHARSLPPIHFYRPGNAEYCSCLSQFYQGTLAEADWWRGYELAVHHRNVQGQHSFHSLRGEWLLARDQHGPALDAIDEALKIVNRLGTPRPEYHDLRAWALAKLGRGADACTELANGEQRRFAAEAWRILGSRERARICALNAYRWAWGEGPPNIKWYDLERSRALLRELGEPESQLPPFDPSKVKPIPYEAEIRAAIARLKEGKGKRNRAMAARISAS